MYTKTIVCLANSRKPPSGRCIAGREFSQSKMGTWVRPVSRRPGQEISEEERWYRNGKDPEVLDIVEISMEGPKPQLHQQENHLIDDGFYWSRKGRISWTELEASVEDPDGPLWTNGSSSYHGQNDRVPEQLVSSLSRSLFLVRPESLTISVSTEGGGDYGPSRRRLRARLKLAGLPYRLAVTDPWLEGQLLSKDENEGLELDYTGAILCVSLGELFNGFAYKLVAAVITAERAEL